MLDLADIKKVFDCLHELRLGYRFGYAGSYAKGKAREDSDLDIVVEGQDILSSDAYFAIYDVLKRVLTIKFDIVDLKALAQDDQMMDEKLLELGLAVNDDSAYKTMRREAVWMS